MENSILIDLLNEGGLSAEDLGRVMGVSGMTVRRWSEKPQDKLPDYYQSAITQAAQKLTAEGRLDGSTGTTKQLLEDATPWPQHATLTMLGLDKGGEEVSHHFEDQMVTGLSQIGGKSEHREFVLNEKQKISTFDRLGQDWRTALRTLTGVIESRELNLFDKLPAFGALYYLLMIVDLIPDTLPLFGLMDDFALLTIASTYYLKRQDSQCSE